MNENTINEIKKLQDNLQTIRKVAGWTTEELGERIGVTKQTISNLENKKTTLTKTQYIAIRAILDYEIVNNSANTALARVVDVLLNQDDETEESEASSIADVSKQAERRKSKELAKISSLAFIAATNPVIMATTINWLSKLLEDNKKK